MERIVNTPPHLRSPQGIPSIMWTVVLALAPAFAWALYNFGWYAILVTALCVGTCILTEWVCQRLRGVPVTIGDGSAVVTGLLLAAVLPPNVSWYVAVSGSVAAIAVAKHLFGGLGNNIWNPALFGRAFLQVAYATEINTGPWPRTKGGGVDAATTSLHGTFDELAKQADVVSSASVLQKLADATVGPQGGEMVRRVGEAGSRSAEYVLHADWELIARSFLGREGGSIAEVSVLFLLLGALYMAWKKVITWEIPVTYIGSVLLLTWILPAPVKVVAQAGAEGVTAYTAWFSGPWLLHLMGGGLVIGAFFMATDMVTSPVSSKGKIIFGLGCGVLTAIIRLYSSAYPEGVCYSILIMNTCVPLIDVWTRPRVFGQTAREG
jgi:electron transport complex protein RnfD